MRPYQTAFENRSLASETSLESQTIILASISARRSYATDKVCVKCKCVSSGTMHSSMEYATFYSDPTYIRNKTCDDGLLGQMVMCQFAL